MANRYVIGCDVGTQGTRAVLMRDDGQMVAQHAQPHRVQFPRPAWAEQDPQEWIDALTASVASVVRTAEVAEQIVGISFGTQLDGVVACDGRGRALRPAIIWMDRRAQTQAHRVAQQISAEDFYHATGTNLDSSHGLFKVLWIRDEEPDVFRSTARFLTPGSFVLQQISGQVATDYSNASSLALLDPRTRTWSAPLLNMFDLQARQLTALMPADHGVGRVRRAFAVATGLSPDTLVAVGCGDEMAATVGAGVIEPGEVCDVAGTAEPVCAVSAEPRLDASRLVECHPHADPSVWLLENPGFVAGGSFRWWRDLVVPPAAGGGVPGGDSYDLLCAEAGRIRPGAEGLVFLPCMQGAMVPEWNGDARGAFYGLTLGHERPHMTRALLEGIAFGLRDILEAMAGAGLLARRITVVGGGSRSAVWRQLKADVTGLPVRVPANVETTAIGAAILAAVGAGLFPSIADAAARFVAYQPEEHRPDPEANASYDTAYRLYRSVYFALKPVFASQGGDLRRPEVQPVAAPFRGHP